MQFYVNSGPKFRYFGKLTAQTFLKQHRLMLGADDLHQSLTQILHWELFCLRCHMSAVCPSWHKSLSPSPSPPQPGDSPGPRPLSADWEGWPTKLSNIIRLSSELYISQCFRPRKLIFNTWKVFQDGKWILLSTFRKWDLILDWSM